MDKRHADYLASLAIFRELYNKKNDVYDIVGIFALDIVREHGLHDFSAREISQCFQDDYSFDIPQAVINAALARMNQRIIKINGQYSIIDQNIYTTTTDSFELRAEQRKRNEEIVNDLHEFIQNNRNAILTSSDKEGINEVFFRFLVSDLLDIESPQYINEISSFIIKCKSNESLTRNLNAIREGVIIHSGLSHHLNLNSLGSWKSELVIYLDTEVLFYLVGYNGMLYQNIVSEFLNLVMEANKKSMSAKGVAPIKLKYFEEVFNEVERFFKSAEQLMERGDIVDPSKTAMRAIINGCNELSDIVMKKMEFFKILEKEHIFQDEQKTYYSESNQQYNIESDSIVQTLSPNFDEEKTREALKFLSHINVLRRGKVKKEFESVEYLLVTGTRQILEIARNGDIVNKNSYPLAVSIQSLTNRLWFKLNKGFGNSETLKSIDIVSRAQIALSFELAKKVSQQFNKLEDQYKEGKLSKESCERAVAELRISAKSAEEIDEKIIDETLMNLNENNIQTYMGITSQLLETNESLNRELEKQKETIEECTKRHENELARIRLENEQEAECAKNTKDELERVKLADDEKTKKLEQHEELEKRRKSRKKIIVILIVILIAGFFVWEVFSDTILGKIIAAIGVVAGIVALIINLIKGIRTRREEK
jgi:uncharacterized membrane protein